MVILLLQVFEKVSTKEFSMLCEWSSSVLLLSSALKLRENYDWHNQSYGHQVLEQPFLQMNTPAAIIHARESHSRLWIVFLRLRDWARENLSQERATRYLVPHLESWTEYAPSWHQPIPSECKHFLRLRSSPLFLLASSPNGTCVLSSMSLIKAGCIIYLTSFLWR